MEKDVIRIQAYTTKELAAIFKTTPKTFRKWIFVIKDQIGPRIGNYFSPKQVKLIVEHLGKPFTWLIALFAKMFFGVEDGGEDEVLSEGGLKR